MPRTPMQEANGGVGASFCVLGCSFSVPLLLDAYCAVSRPVHSQIVPHCSAGRTGLVYQLEFTFPLVS